MEIALGIKVGEFLFRSFYSQVPREEEGDRLQRQWQSLMFVLTIRLLEVLMPLHSI